MTVFLGRNKIMCISVLPSKYINWNLQRGAHPEQRCHSEPARTLVWESPSNSVRPIVIQTVLFVPFPGIHLRKVALLTRGLPHQSEDWFAMTGNSTNSQFSAPLCSPDRSIALARRHLSPYPGPESLLPFCFPWAIMILNQKTTKEKLLWTFGTLPTSAT